MTQSNAQSKKTPPAAAPPAPPRGQRARGRRGVGDLVANMEESFVGIKRGIAGYQALMLSLGTHQGTPVERERGLPIFRFQATATGTDSVECVADLKHVHPDHVSMVLTPLIHVQGRQAHAHLVELLQSGSDLLKALESSLAAQQPQQEYDDQEEPDADGDGREEGE
jgi:hypothetical protein